MVENKGENYNIFVCSAEKNSYFLLRLFLVIQTYLTLLSVTFIMFIAKDRDIQYKKKKYFQQQKN